MSDEMYEQKLRDENEKLKEQVEFLKKAQGSKTIFEQEHRIKVLLELITIHEDEKKSLLQLKQRVEEFFSRHKQRAHDGVASEFCPWCILYQQLLEGEKP